MSATHTGSDFCRAPGRVKRAALSGPVFVTDRGIPSIVVLTIADYERLAGPRKPLLDVLMPGGDQDFEFEPTGVRVANRR